MSVVISIVASVNWGEGLVRVLKIGKFDIPGMVWYNINGKVFYMVE